MVSQELRTAGERNLLCDSEDTLLCKNFVCPPLVRMKLSGGIFWRGWGGDNRFANNSQQIIEKEHPIFGHISFHITFRRNKRISRGVKTKIELHEVPKELREREVNNPAGYPTFKCLLSFKRTTEVTKNTQK